MSNWMPKPWAYLRESPGWQERYPLGPFRFDIRYSKDEIAEVDIPANRLRETTERLWNKITWSLRA
jgi:hypothetical protein